MRLQILSQPWDIEWVDGRIVVNGEELDFFCDAQESKIVVAHGSTPQRLAQLTAAAVAEACHQEQIGPADPSITSEVDLMIFPAVPHHQPKNRRSSGDAHRT